MWVTDAATQLLSLQSEVQAVPDEGATAVEYSVLVALIAAVIIGTVAVIGLDVLGLYQSVQGTF